VFFVTICVFLVDCLCFEFLCSCVLFFCDLAFFCEGFYVFFCSVFVFFCVLCVCGMFSVCFLCLLQICVDCLWSVLWILCFAVNSSVFCVWCFSVFFCFVDCVCVFAVLCSMCCDVFLQPARVLPTGGANNRARSQQSARSLRACLPGGGDASKGPRPCYLGNDLT